MDTVHKHLSVWTRENAPGISETAIGIELEETKDYYLPTGVEERIYLNAVKSFSGESCGNGIIVRWPR